MKVLIKRPLFLGGHEYMPDKAGVELPDKVGEAKVVLYSKEAKEAAAKAVADGKPFSIVLPRDCIAYSDDAAKDFELAAPALLRGNPQVEVTLKDLTPAPAKGAAKVGGPSTDVKP